MTDIEKEQKETRFHKEAVAGIFYRRGDSDDAIPDSSSHPEDHAQTTPNGQVVSLSNDKKQTGKDIDKLKQGQSENNSSIMAYTHFDNRIPSGAGQLWREHFTYYMSPSTSTPSNSKPRHTANPQTGESTCTAMQTSRRCHPLCFAHPSSYQTYAASLGDESRPLSKGKRSVPLSSMITERHPLGLGDDFFSDDSDSDEEVNGKVAL